MLPDCLKSTDVDTARWALEVSHLLAASSHSAEFIKVRLLRVRPPIFPLTLFTFGFLLLDEMALSHGGAF
jgi:hypothetical protein